MASLTPDQIRKIFQWDLQGAGHAGIAGQADAAAFNSARVVTDPWGRQYRLAVNPGTGREEIIENRAASQDPESGLTIPGGFYWTGRGLAGYEAYPYQPSTNLGNTSVDPAFTDDLRMQIIQSNPELRLALQQAEARSSAGGDDRLHIGHNHLRDLYEVANAPNASYLKSYFSSVAPHRANDAEDGWFDNLMGNYVVPGGLAVLGGMAGGSTLSSLLGSGGSAAGAVGPYGGFDAGAIAGADFAGTSAAAAGGQTMLPWADPEYAFWEGLKNPGVGDAGAFDQWGMQSYPGGSSSTTILDNAASQSGLERVLGLPAGTLKNSKDAASTAALLKALGGSQQSGLQRILEGKPSSDDLGNILGNTLGFFGAGQRADAIRELATQSRADRAPFLAKANEWLANPQSYYEGPGAAALKANLHALSATYGNPYDSPNALALATEAGMRNWQSAVTGFGNMGLGGDDTRANLGLRAADADAGKLNAVGSGIEDIFRTPKTDIFSSPKTLAPSRNSRRKCPAGLARVCPVRVTG